MYCCPPILYELISAKAEKEFMHRKLPDVELLGDSASVVLLSLNSFTEDALMSLEMTDFATGF